jgi:signal transduction histidine kinase
LYISYPVINTTGATTSTGKFTGVVVASIRLEMLGNFLKNQIFPQFNSTIGLLDRKGIILYTSPKQFGITTNNQQYVGEYVFGDKFQSVLSSLLPPESKNLSNDLIKKSLQGNTGSADIPINDKMYTIAYQPVVIGGKSFMTLYIRAQHTLTSDVSALIDQQKYITILEVTVIGVVAFIAAFLLFSWNKRLETTVNVRTAELKRANDSLASANEQLKIHDKMQKEFINIAAHELRTPTQSIVAYSELVEMEPERSESHANAILRNAKRLHGLINDILDVTRIESQSLNLGKEQFNLEDLVLSIVRDAQQQIEIEGKDKEIKLEYRQSKDDIVLLHADKQRITQVISNLIDNAIKFTKRGTISIVIDRKRNSDSNSNSQDEVTVSVKDTGSGIHPDILPRLFSKFASKSFQGTGLGLFISKNIIEAHGGKLWGENNADGRGATFTFSLPID